MQQSGHPFGPTEGEIRTKITECLPYLDGEFLSVVVKSDDTIVASVRQIILKMELAANGTDGPPLHPFFLASPQ